MKHCVASIFFWGTLLLFPAISSAQEQTKSLDEFNRDANFHSKTLLLKVLQFTAPYPGFYQQTTLDNGTAFTARVVPNWAVQNSIHAKLNDAVVDQIKQLLAQLKLSAIPAAVEPQRGQLHSAFIFYDGKDFLRLNYNGTVPAEIDAILAILQKEFIAAGKAQSEEFVAHQKLMRETYGDWQQRAGITINTGVGMHRCKGDGALLFSTSGQRNAVAGGSPVAVSVYHALVFYSGAVVSGSGSGGRWSDDPIQSGVVEWTPLYADGVFSEKVLQRKLEILNNAIDATVTIAGKTYRLADGNMFVVRMGADWLPTVTQLKDVLADPATPQTSLDRFKAILKDPSVQKLELF